MFNIRRALISVSDKRGVVPLAKKLLELDIEILSTGGTSKVLRNAGLSIIDVSEKTNFPEIMDGRVKTLHPIIHGGLLGRRGIDESIMKNHNIDPIDLLIVNLYPFEETIANNKSTINEAIENIDIGGPAMIRAASKNHDSVVVIVEPEDYGPVLNDIREGSLSTVKRRKLAAKAYAHTASYDTAITKYLSNTLKDNEFNSRFLYSGNLSNKLRYGENPHQNAAFYIDQHANIGSLAMAKQLQGKELSFNNIADSDAALQCVKNFNDPACVIVKHANPCGVAVSTNIKEAYKKAYETDPTSAFGGIIAFNRPLDRKTAENIIQQQFVEVIVAPKIDNDAANIISQKKNIRLLETGKWSKNTIYEYDYKKISGGLLVQETDTASITEENLNIVTDKPPSPEQIRDMLFAWTVVKYVKSNAIIFCKDSATIGVGAGQMSRVYSTKIAAIKANDENLKIEGSVMASDAFFPFRDGIDEAAKTGITSIIQPGGSVRDDEVIQAANDHGIAMVFTGIRHFRH
ncbi:MAG: bifunctional phosphoribosylaminoimidazolecarboxamide formyltransferase/inosine monophosphate cyclohydrolase [Gammaproteobacteria bacterium]|nr:bifunctional phosphoribosylaminoimidazolecarboxamide formyltransferase/inosine monophosphate cyclohydrolase [Gammaproteobacteria bacterium]|tara:strand:- start:9683 stop:11233 length:1551 start_codon:yes stop_codon:yes gene_type:complete